MGVLGSCVTHIFLIQAAQHQVPIDSLEVEVTGQIDARAGHPGFEHIPVYPHDIGYTVHIASPASREQLDTLFEAVERTCPILNLLKHPQSIRATLQHTRTGAAQTQASDAIPA